MKLTITRGAVYLNASISEIEVVDATVDVDAAKTAPEAPIRRQDPVLIRHGADGSVRAEPWRDNEFAPAMPPPGPWTQDTPAYIRNASREREKVLAQPTAEDEREDERTLEMAQRIADDDIAMNRQINAVNEGRDRIVNLLRSWVVNFGVEDRSVRQPDRHAMLMTEATGYGPQVVAFIEASGGLTAAIRDALILAKLSEPDDAGMLAKRIALQMVTLSTTMGFSLEPYLEHSVAQCVAVQRSRDRLENEPESEWESRVERELAEDRVASEKALRDAPIRPPMRRDTANWQKHNENIARNLMR